jgi:small subunit ribosomal protein S18
MFSPQQNQNSRFGGGRPSSGGRPTTGGRQPYGRQANGKPLPNARQQQLRKKRSCRFCDSKDVYIDYKNEKRLARFINEQGKIIPRRITGTCARHQRQLQIAIKRARHLALLPFVNEAVS